jgi:hypothetical protein
MSTHEFFPSALALYPYNDPGQMPINHCEGVAVPLEAAPESNGSDELKQTI